MALKLFEKKCKTTGEEEQREADRLLPGGELCRDISLGFERK